MTTTVRNIEARSHDGACAWSTAFERTARTARRATVHARYAAEDLADGAALQIRRRPLAAVGLGLATGIAVGALFGLVIGRLHQETVIRRVVRRLRVKRAGALREVSTPRGQA